MKIHGKIGIFVVILVMLSSCSNKEQWEQAINERDEIIVNLQQQLQETQRQLDTCQQDLVSAQEALAVTPSSNPGGNAPTQYDSVYDVLHEWYSYSTDDGTFKILSENPLHIQIVPTFGQDDDPDLNREDVKRALLEAVYRAFIHTDTEVLIVTCAPQLIQNSNGNFEAILLEQYTTTITVSKDAAVRAVQNLLNIQSLPELVTDEKLTETYIQTDAWTKAFNMILYGEDYNTPELLDKLFSKLVG